MNIFEEFFCLHQYVTIEDRYSNAEKRMLNYYGYPTVISKCRFCGKTKEF